MGLQARILFCEDQVETAVTFPRAWNYGRGPSVRLHSMEDAVKEPWKTQIGAGSL
jgi:hypothetical protein